MTGFKELGVSAELTGVLRGQGIAQPTPVQAEAIPPLVQGLDVIARAKTGTGKTLAFLLPILDKIRPERPFPQALILAPTRELALQITEEARKLTEKSDIKILAVYGGQDVEKQLRKLEGGRHLIIGTPGRLLDHMRRETLSLGGVTMLVLDEADQMLHMGFLDEVESIITAVPSRRQTMLFSATMPDPIKQLASSYMRQPIDILIKSGSPIPLDNIRQQVVECTDRAKEEALKALIERDRPYLAIIFCRTKRRVSKLNEALQEAGYDCDELHGDLSQNKREAVMKTFREAKLQLLVATDVAARGLDVEGVTHVFNYDMPLDVDSYIHRIGRTGRAGGKGLAITFASPRDRAGLEMIEKGISQRLERRRYEKGEFGDATFATSGAARTKAAPETARGGRGSRAGGAAAGSRSQRGGAAAGGRSKEYGRREDRGRETGGRREDRGREAAGRGGSTGGGRVKDAAGWSGAPARQGQGQGRQANAPARAQGGAGKDGLRAGAGKGGPQAGSGNAGPRAGASKGGPQAGGRGKDAGRSGGGYGSGGRGSGGRGSGSGAAGRGAGPQGSRGSRGSRGR
ncbi:DEAD/DEAH box helicase [Paenibacillus sp. HN-1]|uniref:DEAD/DEAH box helicase n=1 Tax=Paenibacillus TaxID=44249 RepID=UPI001CA8EEF2|nr:MULTISPECIES: DEAD/DEAH box helicase [Paenibacillus]MBY9077712.1 DEAD/DEAH box helicase [Paenibacillus sp. CGMCC 1.18879]MBY9083709.1 DEAD/DEAH box helicase [Paenibacillus sinensis]